MTVAASGGLGTGLLNLNEGTLTSSAAVTLSNPFALNNNILFASNPFTITSGSAITFQGTGTLTGSTQI